MMLRDTQAIATGLFISKVSSLAAHMELDAAAPIASRKSGRFALLDHKLHILFTGFISSTGVRVILPESRNL